MTLGSLFSGIGGFELAATWAGIKPVWSNEIDKYACKVLRKNFNHEIIEKDIREIGAENLTPVDIISGGFPCQPFSTAGKRKGKSDDRYLWPEMLRVIRELKPKYVIGENVAGLLSMEHGETLKGILFDLENEGYNNEIFSIPACGVGTSHSRSRIWIIAHAGGFTDHQLRSVPMDGNEICKKDTNRIRLRSKYNRNYEFISGNRNQYESIKPVFCRKNDGIPRRVDRLKGLGNAIVPQVAYELFKAIKTIND